MPVITLTEDDILFYEVFEALWKGEITERVAVQYLVDLGRSYKGACRLIERNR